MNNKTKRSMPEILALRDCLIEASRHLSVGHVLRERIEAMLWLLDWLFVLDSEEAK